MIAGKPTSGWYDTIGPVRRERLFAFMRGLGDRAMALEGVARKPIPPHGTIGVGAADFDAFMDAELIQQFLSGLRYGHDIETSLANAQNWARRAVREHNAKRPGDINWPRWEEHGQDKLLSLADETRRVVK